MSLSLYDIAKPSFTQALEGLSHVLTKAEVWAMERHLDAAVLLNYRLSPDMFPLTKQVQAATDHARNSLTRLAGRAVPLFADESPSFDALRHRIARSVSFVTEFHADALEGAETRTIRIGAVGRERELSGQVYFLNFALPNFYFHVTTAYDILRHAGAPIGKRDFLNAS